METLNYNGKTYKRINGNWYDSSNMKVPKVLQKELDSEYSNQIDTSSMNMDELLELADDYKNANNYAKAKDIYEKLVDDIDIETLKFIASKLTSCYRGVGEPEKAIAFFNELNSKYHSAVISSALLTSVASAYMDVDDFDNAKKLADRAYAQSGGKGSGELTLVYQRLKSKNE